MHVNEASEASFHETLRKLRIIHEGFIQDEARLGLDLATAALAWLAR